MATTKDSAFNRSFRFWIVSGCGLAVSIMMWTAGFPSVVRGKPTRPRRQSNSRLTGRIWALRGRIIGQC